MGYDVIASALFSCVFFWLSANKEVTDEWRPVFLYLGFLMIPATYGLQITNSNALLLVALIFIYGLLFGLLIGTQLLAKVKQVIEKVAYG